MASELKRWVVTGTVSASKYLGTYSADTKEQAEEMAMNDPNACSVSLCHRCSSECEDPEIVNAEASEARDGQ